MAATTNPQEREAALLRIRCGKSATTQLSDLDLPAAGAVAVFPTAVVTGGLGGATVAAGKPVGFGLHVSLEPGTALPAGRHQVEVCGRVADLCVTGTFEVAVGYHTPAPARYRFTTASTATKARVTKARTDHATTIARGEDPAAAAAQRAIDIRAAYRDHDRDSVAVAAPAWASQLPGSLRLDVVAQPALVADLAALQHSATAAMEDLVEGNTGLVVRAVASRRDRLVFAGERYSREDAHQDAYERLLSEIHCFASPARPDCSLSTGIIRGLNRVLDQALDMIDGDSAEVGRLRRWLAAARDRGVAPTTPAAARLAYRRNLAAENYGGDLTAVAHLDPADLPETKMSEGLFAMALAPAKAAVSLDVPVGDSVGCTLGDLLPANHDPELTAFEDADTVHSWFRRARLVDVERFIVQERLQLLSGGHPAVSWDEVVTAADIGGAYSNPESAHHAARRVWNTALAKLRAVALDGDVDVDWTALEAASNRAAQTLLTARARACGGDLVDTGAQLAAVAAAVGQRPALQPPTQTRGVTSGEQLALFG